MQRSNCRYTKHVTTNMSHRRLSPSVNMRLLPAALITLMVMGATLSACKEDNPVAVAAVDSNDAPTMLTRDVETLISDSGVTRFRIVTPIWYVYDEVDEPYWYFPQGLHLDKFDNFFRRDASIVTDTATYFKNKQLWRLDGNVNITNVVGEKFLTNQLFWDQRQRKLYSDSFIHIERPDEVLEGYGFDSNEQLTRYNIRNVSGIFPANSFRKDSPQASSAPDAEMDADQSEAPDSAAGVNTIRRAPSRPSSAPQREAMRES